MKTKSIMIDIDSDLAQIYQSAPEETKSKLSLLFDLWIRELANRSISLDSLMDIQSDKAKKRGLTPAKLEELLRAR